MNLEELRAFEPLLKPHGFLMPYEPLFMPYGFLMPYEPRRFYGLLSPFSRGGVSGDVGTLSRPFDGSRMPK